MKNIINRDASGRLHGYQEIYYFNDTIQTRIICKNGTFSGYTEWHGSSHSFYYIK
jgi:hypothetical protein